MNKQTKALRKLILKLFLKGLTAQEVVTEVVQFYGTAKVVNIAQALDVKEV